MDKRPGRRASDAEERIRMKAENRLRARFPDARIIHELELGVGVRLDLAAVTHDEIVLVEIKSERDTLTRLGRQMKAAQRIGAETWLCIAPKWKAEVERLGRMTTGRYLPHPTIKGASVGETNPDYIEALTHPLVLTETEDGFEEPRFGWRPRVRLNNRALLAMIWADELRAMTVPYGSKPRSTREETMALAHEHMTGREIRRACCAALRARAFPRADERIAA